MKMHHKISQIIIYKAAHLVVIEGFHRSIASRHRANRPAALIKIVTFISLSLARTNNLIFSFKWQYHSQ